MTDMPDTYRRALDVVAEAIHWYGTNPQAEASPAEVITSALDKAGLLARAGAASVASDDGMTKQARASSHG